MQQGLCRTHLARSQSHCSQRQSLLRVLPRAAAQAACALRDASCFWVRSSAVSAGSGHPLGGLQHVYVSLWLTTQPKTGPESRRRSVEGGDDGECAARQDWAGQRRRRDCCLVVRCRGDAVVACERAGQSPAVGVHCCVCICRPVQHSCPHSEPCPGRWLLSCLVAGTLHAVAAPPMHPLHLLAQTPPTSGAALAHGWTGPGLLQHPTHSPACCSSTPSLCYHTGRYTVSTPDTHLVYTAPLRQRINTSRLAPCGAQGSSSCCTGTTTT